VSNKESTFPDPIVGQGHPLDPNRGQVLSEDDEKRMDDQGRPIAEGLLWGKAGTGLYLCIAVTKGIPWVDRPLIGGTHTDVSKKLRLTLGVAHGRPRLQQEFWGAALELPVDLGRDKVKRQYVVEWLKDTVLEAIEACESATGAPARAGSVTELGLWVAAAAETAIHKAGL
jgi:hypothetical protein